MKIVLIGIGLGRRFARFVYLKEVNMRKETRRSLIFTGLGLVMSIGLFLSAMSQHDAVWASMAVGIGVMYAGLFVFFLRIARAEAKEKHSLEQSRIEG